jgi:UDP-glucose 4-epimerase
MKVLITGGAGFIGSHLAEMHLLRGDKVHVVDDLSTGAMANIDCFLGRPKFRFDHADLLAWPGLGRAVAGVDRIYHMAAVVGMFRVLREPVETTRVNVLGCERLLHAVARSGRRPQIVLPSSSSVYGRASYEDLHERADIVASPGAPLLNYALSKLTNEVQGRAYAEKFELPIVIARLFNTVGPRQSGLYGFVVPRFVQQAVSGQPITVFGDGTQTRSFCDVRDTVAMLDTLAATPAAYGVPVNVGNLQEITIRELAELICERTGSSSSLQFIPYAQAYGQSFEQIPQRRPILDRLFALTGYRHRWPLYKTIDELARHYREPRARVQPSASTAAPVALAG